MSDLEEKKAIPCKVVLIGESGVGKTSIISRYMTDTFSSTLGSTPGANFTTKTVLLKNENQSIKLQLWDTAGTEKFRSITTGYYRGANAAFVVFDLTSKASFKSLNEWIENYYKYSNPDYERHVILIGNKSDLKNERIITENEIDDFVKLNKIKYFETSAKNGENIDDTFLFIAEQLMKDADEKGILYNEKSGNINDKNLKNNAVDINGGNRCCF